MNATRTALILAALLCSCQGKEGEGAPDASKGTEDPRLEKSGETSKSAAAKPKSDADLSSIKLPPGFIIQTYAKVPNARTIAKGPDGTLFIGTRTDAVYAVQPVAGAEPKVTKIISGLTQANGVLFDDGNLYIAELTRLLRVPGIMGKIGKPLTYDVLRTYPNEPQHGWKIIRKGPDGYFYIPIGVPCNVCDRSDPIFGSITRVKPDGTGQDIFARGIRNSVGFDWHPETKQLWFTDNGRDQLGDEIPGDELNRASKMGNHYGFPYCHNAAIKDPEFGAGHDCSKYTAPAQVLGPHVAALGMRFYTGKSFPEKYRGQVFIAEHGSWNRSKRIGYRVMLVTLNGNTPTSYVPFLSGFLDDATQKVTGRPVDVETADNGDMFLTDDQGGRVFRIRYVGE